MKVLLLAIFLLVLCVGIFIYGVVISGGVVYDKENSLDQNSVFLFDSERRGESYNEFALLEGELYATARFEDLNLYYYSLSHPSSIEMWSKSNYPLELHEELNLIKEGDSFVGVWFSSDNDYVVSKILFKREGGETKIISDLDYASMCPVFFKHSNGDYWVIYGDNSKGNIWYVLSKNKGEEWSAPEKIPGLEQGLYPVIKEVGSFEYKEDVYVYVPTEKGLFEFIYDYGSKQWRGPEKIVDYKDEYLDMDLKALKDSKDRIWVAWGPAYGNSMFYWIVKDKGKWGEVQSKDFGLHQDGDIVEYEGQILFISEGKVISLN